MILAPPAPADAFPRCRPVADHALLVEFGEVVDREVHDQVLQLDAALAAEPFGGFAEAVPAYASLLICFDPVVTDHKAVETAVEPLIVRGPAVAGPSALREIEVCYDRDLAPDLDKVAEASGLTPDQVIESHLSGDYSVFLYGFAPGYAYLAGVPEQIHLTRKQAAVRDVPCPITARARAELRIVLGPQDRFFSNETINAFLSQPFELTGAYDRMGVRLTGPSLHPSATLDMPSEAIVRGSVQVSGDGVATVLLADHQTTGGYPKIATVISADLDAFSQLRPHSKVAFKQMALEEAIAAARYRHQTQTRYLEILRGRPQSLSEKLFAHNLSGNPQSQRRELRHRQTESLQCGVTPAAEPR